MRHSFKLSEQDRNRITNQIGLVRNIAAQYNQIRKQLNHETEHLNTLWRSACLQAKLDDNLQKDCSIIDMLRPDGSLAATIDGDGTAVWMASDSPKPNQ